MWHAAVGDFAEMSSPCAERRAWLFNYTAPWDKASCKPTLLSRRERRTTLDGNSVKRAVAKVLEELAISKNTIITSVAMAYIIQKAPYVFLLVGGRTVEHIKGNIEALDSTDEDIAMIEGAYKFDHGFPHAFLSETLFGDENDKPAPPEGPQDAWLTNIMGTFDWVEPTKAIKLKI